ncbi:uncharacterized protein ZBAI_04889 [Zygosaccharomyces bailii ISA1307]|nr:uncharacterized protein ZBAI_04889 [Zygosaccharomyces bailii ISA1307]
MKLVFPLAALVSLGQSLLIQRDEDSSRESVSTVYTFVGASGSASKVLQMPSSSGESSEPHETSDGKQESSALSQLLHASTGASGNSTAFQTAKITESPSVSTSSAAKSQATVPARALCLTEKQHPPLSLLLVPTKPTDCTRHWWRAGLLPQFSPFYDHLSRYRIESLVYLHQPLAFPFLLLIAFHSNSLI